MCLHVRRFKLICFDSCTWPIWRASNRLLSGWCAKHLIIYSTGHFALVAAAGVLPRLALTVAVAFGLGGDGVASLGQLSK